MLDLRLRPTKDRVVAPLATRLARFVGPLALTAAGLALTLAAAALAAVGLPWPALAAWLGGRLLDGLDGPVARLRDEGSDLGGYLDMLADTVGYAAVPLGVAVGVGEQGTWVAVAVLLAVLSVNTISWSYLAAVLEKRGAGAATTGEATTVTMRPALVEGTETIVLHSVLVALPGWAAWTASLMAVLVAVNVVQRVAWARRGLRP